jgi:hypothetical protein
MSLTFPALEILRYLCAKKRHKTIIGARKSIDLFGEIEPQIISDIMSHTSKRKNMMIGKEKKAKSGRFLTRRSKPSTAFLSWLTIICELLLSSVSFKQMLRWGIELLSPEILDGL